MRHAPLLALALLCACGDNDRTPETIADHVELDGRFSDLESVLRRADLLARLDDPNAEHTLFAPTDEAFAALQIERGLDVGALLDRADLADLAGHHVVDRALTAAQLERVTALLPLGGPEIHVRAGLDGVRLDDQTLIVAEPIEATNGVIYILDAVLDRPLITQTRSFLMQPDLDINELGGFASTFLTVEDEGFIHDLRVVVDIETTTAGDLFVFVQRGEEGFFHSLVRGAGAEADDVSLTFADGARLDATSDATDNDSGGEAFPEASYRPFQPLEFYVGASVRGEWQLHVFSTGFEATPVLREWGIIATYGDEPPTPALVFNRSESQATFARGFTETAGASFRRVGGLEGEVEVAATTGDLSGPARTVSENRGAGTVAFEVPTDAELGDRDLVVSIASGAVSRIRHVNAEVVNADAEGVDLLAHVSLPELGFGLRGNDLWGWTDSMTGVEYVLMGTSAETAFVDISDPSNPVVVAVLPTQTFESDWRDIKVFADHAFIVSEAQDHGLQVFDLTQLRGATAGQTVTPTAHLAAFGNAHNIAIDEDSGFAYVVGATQEEGYPATCSGGLLMLDINTPNAPSVAGCFAGGVPSGQIPGTQFPTAAYTHDAQCLTYNGPDTDHQGAQICITSDGVSDNNDNALAIADVTDKQGVAQLARIGYNGAGYAHQGWLTEDHRYFILNDEFDEFNAGVTRSYVFDLTDLDNPTLHGTFDNPRDAVGHNTYVKGNVAYQANYTSGLRLVDISGIETMALSEIAYFDTFPRDDGEDDGVAARCSSRPPDKTRPSPDGARHPEAIPDSSACGREQSFRGAWSTFPFFDSGVVAVSDIDRGLFLFRPTVALP